MQRTLTIAACLVLTPLVLGQSLLDLAVAASTPSGPQLGALLRASLDLGSGDGYDVAGGDASIGGVRFQDARVWIQGDVGAYFWRLSFDAAGYDVGGTGSLPDPAGTSGSSGSGTPQLLDAYVKWQLSDAFFAQLGRFSGPSTRSSGFTSDKQVFVDRTVIGQYFDAWDEGVALGGTLGAFSIAACVQNGLDDASEDVWFSGRVEWAWNGGCGSHESAQSAPDGWAGRVGLAYASEGDAAVDDDAFVLDAVLTHDQRVALGGEVLHAGEDFASQLALAAYTDDATPWDVYASWTIVPSEWELGVRWQDLDDPDSTTLASGVLNRLYGGAKWQFEITTIDSDLPVGGTLVRLGFALGSDG